MEIVVETKRSGRLLQALPRDCQRGSRASRTALLVALACLACSEAPAPGSALQLRFLEPSEATNGPHPTQLVSFGDTARHALCDGETWSFEVPLRAERGRTLTFAFAARPAEGAKRSEVPVAPAGITFRVVGVGSGRSQLLFEASSDARDEAWNSQRLDLEAFLADGSASALRFETRIPPGTGTLETCWASVLVSGDSPSAPPGPRPHVILISLDTLGASHLSSFDGVPDTSPRIDGFLAESHSFRRAYAPYGNTFTSHSSLFSARYPRRHGRYSIFTPLDSLVTEFAKNGYRTAAFTEVGWVRSAFGFAEGFDSYVDGQGKGTPGLASETFSRATTWIREHADLGPFFLFLHTYEVHVPYLLRDGQARHFAAELFPGPLRTFEVSDQVRMSKDHNTGARPIGRETLALWQALYRAEINHLDIEIGKFLDALEASGVASDAIVVMTSDHGELFGEGGKVGHGSSVHGRGLHVPLAFRWPGRIEPARSEEAVSLVDVLPTLFELLDFGVEESPDAVSLADVLLGRAAGATRAVIAEGLVPHPCDAGRRRGCNTQRVAAFRGSLKLVRDVPTGTQRLYDLDADPFELRDRAGERPDAVAELGEQIDAYLTIERHRDMPKEIPLDPEVRAQLRALGYEE